MEDCGNVLVIGGKGVGKSTLIRAVIGSQAHATAEGIGGQLTVYEDSSSPLRIIDVGGSFFSHHCAVRSIKRWSKKSALDDDANNDINVIWFCVEGKSRKLIRQQIARLSRATDVWRTVPIIVVLTKSYAKLEQDENVLLVQKACKRRRRLSRSLRAVIPVVASAYSLDETAFVAPEGMPELIQTTVQLLPEGVRAANKDIQEFSLRRKRSMARGIVAASAAAGAAVGAVPIPLSDAMILTSVETTMAGALAKLYGIDTDSASKGLLATILEAGTVSSAAKSAISALKAVPGINLATSVLNAAVAGAVVATIGEGTSRVFERIYRGEKTIDDSEWAREFVESKLSKDLVKRGTKLLDQVSESGGAGKQRASIAALLADYVRK